MSAAKKSTSRSAAKKPAAKRAPAKKPTTTKVTRASQPAESAHTSFRVSKHSKEEFFTFRVTRQTLYWLILSGIVLLLGLWVLNISLKVERIYDQIDSNTRASVYNDVRY